MYQKNERVSIVESKSKKKKKMKHNAQDSTKIEKKIPNNNTKAKELAPITKKEVLNKTPNNKERKMRQTMTPITKL
ncbi:2152_t:CDS:2, partial [Gigaspora margarita]